MENMLQKSLKRYRSSLRVGNLTADKGIQMEEMSKLSWLMGVVRNATWANSLYFLYLLLLSFPKS
jgi:hypothetical protein